MINTLKIKWHCACSIDVKKKYSTNLQMNTLVKKIKPGIFWILVWQILWVNSIVCCYEWIHYILIHLHVEIILPWACLNCVHYKTEGQFPQAITFSGWYLIYYISIAFIYSVLICAEEFETIDHQSKLQFALFPLDGAEDFWGPKQTGALESSVYDQLCGNTSNFSSTTPL